MIWPGIASSQQVAEAPPAICTVSLSGDAAPGFGLAPAQVDGRRIFISDVTSPPPGTGDIYVAAQLSPNGKLPGECVAELSYPDPVSGVESWLMLANGDASLVVIVTISGVGIVAVTAQVGGVSVPESLLVVPDSHSGVVAIGMDGGNGDVEIYVGGVPQSLASLNSYYAGLFAAQSATLLGAALSVFSDAESPVSAEVILSVAASTMQATYPSGKLDWCGNALS